MLSNYPPGVTGNEPEIAGYDEADVTVQDFTCPRCEAVAAEVDGVRMRASRYAYVDIVECPSCGATTETEHDVEDDRDPDEDRDDPRDMWED